MCPLKVRLEVGLMEREGRGSMARMGGQFETLINRIKARLILMSTNGRMEGASIPDGRLRRSLGQFHLRRKRSENVFI